ncbi:hypothetical protein BU15DRAFT_60461 [Melanogaster broomeanus]|nr:hypothetical protein BU15DRAFT_60461 [Melanogaster broomeanus]
MPSSRHYRPTVADILRVRRYFTLIPHPLPSELVDDILDLASYWAHTSLILKELQNRQRGQRVHVHAHSASRSPQHRGRLYARSSGHKSCDLYRGSDYVSRESLVTTPSGQPLCTRAHPCRKIVFQLWSHDQGWITWHIRGDQGTYRESWTWFNARVETPLLQWNLDLCVDSKVSSGKAQSASVPESRRAQLKRSGTSKPMSTRGDDHVPHSQGSAAAARADARGRDWKALDGKFVNAMKQGDCIALWMRARYPGWQCSLEKAKISVYWAV